VQRDHAVDAGDQRHLIRPCQRLVPHPNVVTPIRGREETPDRLTALRFYTLGSAWFAFADDKRGSLEAGKLADLAVLSADYLTVPTDQIGELESVLTLVGGEVVYAAGDFARLAR